MFWNSQDWCGKLELKMKNLWIRIGNVFLFTSKLQWKYSQHESIEISRIPDRNIMNWRKKITFPLFSETAWCPVVVPWNPKLEINLDFRRTKHLLEEMELGPNSSMTSFSSISNSHHSGEESSASLKREIEDAFESNYNPQVEFIFESK